MNLQEQWPDWRDEINDAIYASCKANTSMVSVQHRALLQSQIVILKGLAVQLGGRVTEKEGIPFIEGRFNSTKKVELVVEVDKPRIEVEPSRLPDGTDGWVVVEADYSLVKMQAGPERGLVMDGSELAVWEQRGWVIQKRDVGAER